MLSQAGDYVTFKFQPVLRRHQGGVAAALDVLAQSSLVGLRAESEQLARALGELVGEDLTNISLFPTFPKVIELAEIIRRSRHRDTILEKDLQYTALIWKCAEGHEHATESFVAGMSLR